MTCWNTLIVIEDNITEYDRILSRMAKTDHRSQRIDGTERDWSHNGLCAGRQYR